MAQGIHKTLLKQHAFEVLQRSGTNPIIQVDEFDQIINLEILIGIIKKTQ